MGKTESAPGGVKFGTDGWRAVIADTYTFENVKRVALATALTFKDHPKIGNGIIIGFDTRFMSQEFAGVAANVIADLGIKVTLMKNFVTTPTVSLLARDKDFALGVMITASHNPFNYNGYKLKDEFGGSMDPDEIMKIEAKLSDIENVPVKKSFDQLIDDGLIEMMDGREYYVEYLNKKLDTNLIRNSGLKVAFDAMYGAGQGLPEEFLKVTELHGEVNPTFGKFPPEPVEKNLGEIMTLVKNENYNIGIVTDGDADRIAIIDENGNFLDAQKTFALFLKYLYEKKGLKGKVVRGFSTSELIEKLCNKFGLELETVPIGFKHISKIMIKEDVLIGAEESGGIGIKGHLPERDGVFNGLLYLEMLSAYGKSISELKKELDDEFGSYYYNRIDQHTTEERKNNALRECSQMKTGDLIGGKSITAIDDLDGYKFSFDNGWIILRASGTEPLLRIYCETKGIDETKNILENTISQFELSRRDG